MNHWPECIKNWYGASLRPLYSIYWNDVLHGEGHSVIWEYMEKKLKIYSSNEPHYGKQLNI